MFLCNEITGVGLQGRPGAYAAGRRNCIGGVSIAVSIYERVINASVVSPGRVFGVAISTTAGRATSWHELCPRGQPKKRFTVPLMKNQHDGPAGRHEMRPSAQSLPFED